MCNCEKFADDERMWMIFWVGVCVFLGGVVAAAMSYRRRNRVQIWESGRDFMEPIRKKDLFRLISVPDLEVFELEHAIDLGLGQTVRGDVEAGERIVYRLMDRSLRGIELRDTTALPAFHNDIGAHMMTFRPGDTSISDRFRPSYMSFAADDGRPAQYQVLVL